MTPTDFSAGITRVANVLGRKIPETAIDAYYEDLNHLPAEAWMDICKSMARKTRVGAQIPSINDFMGAWSEWQSNNHNRMVGRQSVPCPDCDGFGVFSVWYFDKRLGYHYSFGVRCPCPNGDKTFPADYPHRFSKKEAEERGYILKDPWHTHCEKLWAERAREREQRKKAPEPKKGDLSGLADMALKDMPAASLPPKDDRWEEVRF